MVARTLGCHRLARLSGGGRTFPPVIRQSGNRPALNVEPTVERTLLVGLWFAFVVLTSMFGVWRVRRVYRTVSRPVCAECRYSLIGLTPDAICPECGSPFRLRHRINSRTYFVPVVGRLPVIWLIFLIVPPLWAYANLFGTTFRYATVEGFSAGWRNASVAFGEAVTIGEYYELLTPCAIFIALAAIFWPWRTRWLIAAALVLFIGWASWSNVNSWHRHNYYARDVPVRLLIQIAAFSVATRAVYLYFRSLAARNRLSRHPWKPLPPALRPQSE